MSRDRLREALAWIDRVGYAGTDDEAVMIALAAADKWLTFPTDDQREEVAAWLRSHFGTYGRMDDPYRESVDDASLLLEAIRRVE